MKFKPLACTLSASLILALSACGGGGGGASTGPTSPVSIAGSTSSGSISAFGSVFVNGHEFKTTGASVTDDDTGTTPTSALEVGMVVDVKQAAGSTAAAPEASELHLHPLVRGYVDSSDTSGNTLTVMGQSVQLTSATNFSDHRSCLTAATSACTALTGQSGLTATTGSAGAAVAGSYVTVHGYLFGTSAGSANVVATLISVADAPAAGASGPVFKAEGMVSAASATGVTIGGLSVDLTQATCKVSGSATPCASAFSVGQVVATAASAQPALPVATLVASRARSGAKVTVDVAGTPVEVEGSVASVMASPASFVLRGMTIDASAAGIVMPAAGDIVRVTGTVASNGESITASAVKVLHSAASASVAWMGDVNGVAAGTAANSYTFSILGQSVTVTADTRLMDHSTRGWDMKADPATNPFNITTFQTYLAASKSQHVIVVCEANASGNLSAVSVKIVPADAAAGVAGLVDATPVPVNSGVTGTPSTFAIHGLSVSADPAAVFSSHPMAGTPGMGMDGKAGNAAPTSMQSVAAGDEVLVLGIFAAGKFTVTATPSRSNGVIDFGAPKPGNHGKHGGF